MNAWIAVAVLAALLAAVAAAWSSRQGSHAAAQRRSPYFGFSVPLLFLLIFSSQLTELIPGLTFVDIAALAVMGGVSGYFLHVIVTAAGRGRDDELRH